AKPSALQRCHWRRIAMNRKLALVVLGLASLAALSSFALADDDKNQEEEYNVWMERKLHCSQEVLAGLATADFKMIESNAETMNRLTKIERFLRRKDAEEYRTQLRIFEY